MKTLTNLFKHRLKKPLKNPIFPLSSTHPARPPLNLPFQTVKGSQLPLYIFRLMNYQILILDQFTGQGYFPDPLTYFSFDPTGYCWKPVHQLAPSEISERAVPSFYEPRKKEQAVQSTGSCEERTREAAGRATKGTRQKKQREKDSDYKVKGQNARRNIFSNIVRHLLNYIRNRKFCQPKVEAIITRNSLKTTPEAFFKFMMDIKLTNYIRVQTIIERWFTDSDCQNAKIFRMLSHHFLKSKAHSSVQLAKKIREEHKADHHRKIREVLRLLSSPQP